MADQTKEKLAGIVRDISKEYEKLSDKTYTNDYEGQMHNAIDYAAGMSLYWALLRIAREDIFTKEELTDILESVTL